MEKYIVKRKIKIKAPAEAVWDALTNPRKTKEYFFNCEVRSRWKPGSSITFKGKMFFFFTFERKGRILEIEPNKLLKYTLNNSKYEGQSIVTDRLSFDNGITTVLIRDDVGPEEGAKQRYKKSLKGWDKILKGLKKFVEAEV